MKAESEKAPSLFQQWLEVTTCHGFFDLGRARTALARTVWSLLIFCCLTFMCLQLYRNIAEYSNHQWKTSVQEIPKSSLALPMMVICNVNRLKLSKVKEYNLTMGMVSYMFMNFGLTAGYPAGDFDFSEEENFINWRKGHNFSHDDIYNHLGHTCKDIFMGEVCNYYDIKTIDTMEYGKCQLVNLNLTTSMVGSKGGRQFYLDTQGWEYLPLVKNNFLYEGLVMQVTYTGMVEIGQWISLYPGTRTSLAMQAIEKRVREEPSSVFSPFALFKSKPSCAMHPTMLFSNETFYSFNNCFLECVYVPVFRDCQCAPFVRNDLYRKCEVEEIVRCCLSLENNFTAFAINQSKDYTKDVEKCQERCETPCNVHYIESQATISKAPSDQQALNLEAWMIENNILNSRLRDMILLEVYFSSLSVKLIEQYEAMTLDNLVSSSGGLLGIWAGMSFFTIFQAITYLFHCIVKQSTKKSKKLKIKSGKGEVSTKC